MLPKTDLEEKSRVVATFSDVVNCKVTEKYITKH